MCTLSVSNVIYHKFSHGAAFYTALNGKNVNVMLEFMVANTVVTKQSDIANIAPNSDASSFKTLGFRSSGPTNLSSYLRGYPRHRRGRPTVVLNGYTFLQSPENRRY